MKNNKDNPDISKKDSPMPEWSTIKESDLQDFSLMKDPYPIPAPARKRSDLVFRWIENSPERIKEIQRRDPPQKWWACNGTNTPFLEKFIDPSDGAVHCKDQILVVKPRWMRDIEKGATDDRFEALLNTKNLDNKVYSSNRKVRWESGQGAQIGAQDVIMGNA